MDVKLLSDRDSLLADPYWAQVLLEQDAEWADPVFGGQTPEWSDELGGRNLRLFLKDEITAVVCAYVMAGEEFDVDDLDEVTRPTPCSGAGAGVLAMADGSFVALRATSGVEWDGTTDCCLRAYVHDWAGLEWASSAAEAIALGLSAEDRRLLGLEPDAAGWPGAAAASSPASS